MQSFEDFGVSPSTVLALKERGITAPFEIQARVLPDALAGSDVLAKSPTGSGKTLAFALPIVEALKDNPTSLNKSVRVAAVYGGVALPEQAKIASKAHVIVATPGRLTDLLERNLLSLTNISILVLDEADRMLDMGFKPQVDRIVKKIPSKRQTMFFSATLDGDVAELARAYTSNAIRVEGRLPEERLNGDIEHRFIPVTEENKLDTLTSLISDSHGLTLVFVRTKRGADRLALRLKKAGLSVESLHGDMGQGAREKALKRFEEGKVQILVATDVAARGLDLDDISHVINFDPPEEIDTYTHRVGRTGRAGRSGVGITLILPDQQADMGRVARMNGQAENFNATGMIAAKPKLVYSSRGRRSKW
jgi:ATP-dependent RNA helicase RhlE